MAIGAGDLVVNLRMNNKALLQGYDGSARATEDYSQRLLRNTSALGGVDSAMDRHTSLLVQQTRVRQSLNSVVFEADDALEASSNSMRLNQGIVSNLSFAVEDMASVYGTQGLAGAVRAGANNFTAIAAQLGPQVLLVTSLTTAVVQLGLSFLKTGEDAEEAAHRQSKALEELGRVRDSDLRAIDNEVSRERRLAGIETAGDAAARISEINPEVEALERQRRRFQVDRRGLEDREQELRGEVFARGDEPGLLDESDPIRRALDEIENEREEIDDGIARIGERLADITTERFELQNRLPELQASDAEQFTFERRSEMFNAQRRDQLRRRRAAREAAEIESPAADTPAERDGLLQRAGSLALAELERSSRDTLRRVNPNLSAEQSQFLAGQALGGGEISDEKKRIRLAELTEKHLQKLRQIAEQEQRQEEATTAEEFAVATFP